MKPVIGRVYYYVKVEEDETVKSRHLNFFFYANDYVDAANKLSDFTGDYDDIYKIEIEFLIEGEYGHILFSDENEQLLREFIGGCR